MTSAIFGLISVPLAKWAIAQGGVLHIVALLVLYYIAGLCVGAMKR